MICSDAMNPSSDVIEHTLQQYSFPRLLQMVQHGICSIDYIEKSIKWKKHQCIQDKIAFGVTSYITYSQEDILGCVFKDVNSSQNVIKRITYHLKELEKNGYLREKNVFHIGKELHSDGWKSELYIPYEHKLHKNAYGIAFELDSLECSHYEDMDCEWMEVLSDIRNYLKNNQFNALCYTLGHIPGGKQHKHLKKTDPRYLYSIYFSVFLPYLEIAHDLEELFYVFTKQPLKKFLPMVEGFPIVSIIHISQEIEELPQCTIYFRRETYLKK